MAIVDFTKSSLVQLVWNNNVVIYTWAGLTTGDTGKQLSGPGFTDVSVQVEGNFGGATVTLQGSNDGNNWHTLVDPFNNPISLTSPGLVQVLPICMYMRPSVSGGVGTSITVTSLYCNHGPN